MKKEKLTFFTLFPRIENIHLVKDVGMIPYAMQKYYKYDSNIVIYKNQNYEYFDKDVKNLSKSYFPLNLFNSKFNSALYLIKNAKKIDILHLYHIGERTTMVNIPLYFLFNRNGLIYIHLDDDNVSTDHDDIICIEGNSIKKIVKRFFLKKFVYTKKNRERILFGVQNESGVEILKKQFPFDNVEYISNAYEDTTVVDTKFKKENIILFVGRVGSKQKRTDILLDGFKKAYPKIKNWKLRIVGPIEEDFKEKIEDFYNKNPKLKSKVDFVGPIYDRNELKKEYQKANIFCLTSDYESFGLVLVEALANGCTIVSSDLAPSKDIINTNEYGRLFERGNSDDLCKILIETCNDKKLLNYVIDNSENYVMTKFSYKVTLKPLDKWIKRKTGNRSEKR